MHERINFNPYTSNIFTDASVRNMNYGFDSCSAICALLGDSVILTKAEVNRNTTNNFGEMYAIYMGVNEALKYIISKTNIRTFNLFSDSMISILGLKKWYKNWVLDADGYLIGTSGRISNQSLICSIMNTIITYKINISFYHIRGHVKVNDKSSFNEFKNKFITINEDIGPSKIEDDTFKKLAYYNDYVDNYSRELVQKSDNYPICTVPINKYYNFSSLDMKAYSDLINPRVIHF